MRKTILLTSFIALLIVACTPTYMVVFSGSEGGSVSTPGGEFDEGSTVSVTAQPNAEYEFERWSDGSTQSTRTLTVLEAVNLTAYFVKKQYEFTVNVQGEGTVKQEVVIQGSKINSGSQVKLTALPATGWYFDSWTGNATGNTNPLTVDIDGSKTITAVFKRQKFDLTVTVVGEGIVTEEVVVQPAQYDYETQVKLTAVPETGWEFTAWSGDLESTENPVTVTVEEAQNITATFTRKKYDLTVTVVGEGTVTEEVVVQPAQYDYETQVKLTATAAEGWKFVGWSGDLESTENPVTISLQGATDIVATFQNEFDINITVVGPGSVDEKILIEGGRYNYGSVIRLEAIPEQYGEFTSWSGDIESTETVISVTANGPKEITATFSLKKFNLEIDVVGEGTVTEEVIVQPGVYDYGSQVKLTAVPEEGWLFQSWSGAVNNTSNPVIVTINNYDYNVTAKFIRDSDFDGVPDLNDLCPDTEIGVPVNEFGCSSNQTPCDALAGTWTITGSDAYGDGWNGASVDVIYKNQIIFNFTVSSRTNTRQFYIPDNSAIPIFHYYKGDWDSEVGLKIIKPNGSMALEWVPYDAFRPEGIIILNNICD